MDLTLKIYIFLNETSLKFPCVEILLSYFVDYQNPFI